jgi:hypothetical protein
LLQKHPLVATATAIAAACHSPPLQPRSLRGFIVVVFVIIVSSSALPSPPSSPPSSVIYLIVMSSCPLPSIVVHSSSFYTHFITISSLAPPSFVDCCFIRWTKPLLPTMVSSLSSWPSALVVCFRCPPPPTLTASHGSCHQQSAALTAGTLTSPSPSPPLVVTTPPAVLPLCGVFRTLAA